MNPDYGYPMKIWLDDSRPPPNNQWVWIDSYEHLIAYLNQEVKGKGWPISEMSFDHDLGGTYDGYDCIKVLTTPEYCEYYPIVVNVHSANPVGEENITRYDEWYRRMRKEAYEALG